MAQVVNGFDRVQRKRDGRVVGLREGEVYIGQPSRWGNPFELRNGSRDLAVAQYRTWLWAEIRAGRVRLEDLAALHGLTLVCWCAPKACHGHVLARAAAWAEGRRIEAEIERHDQAQAEAFVDADELDQGAWAEHLRRLEAEAEVRASPAASRSSANEHGLARAEADRERWIRS